VYDKAGSDNYAPQSMPMYTRFKDPMVYNYNGGWREVTYMSLIKKAKAAGHDGLILLNTSDGAGSDNIFVSWGDNSTKSQMQRGEFGENSNIMKGAAGAATAAGAAQSQENKDDTEA